MLTLLAVLVLSTPAHATRVEATTIPCADGTTTKVHRLVAAVPAGWDADGATYSKGGSFRALEVSTCPDGLSLYGQDLALGLSPAQRQTVEPVLARLRASVDSVRLQDLPARVRHQHAAEIYEALGRTEDAARLRLSAAWLARDEAVGDFQGVNGPVEAYAVLEGGEAELEKELTPATRKQVLFNLVVVAHRSGEPEARDALIGRVKALELTAEESARVASFEQAVGEEHALLTRALPLLKAWAGKAKGADAATVTWILAETLRRVGQRRIAQPLLKAVAANGEAPQDVRALARFQLDVEAGKRPWTREDSASLTRVPGFAL